MRNNNPINSIYSMEQKRFLSQAVKKLKSDVLELSNACLNDSSNISLRSFTEIFNDYHMVVTNIVSQLSQSLQGEVFDNLRWFVSNKDNIAKVGKTDLEGVLSRTELQSVFLMLYNAIMRIELKVAGNGVSLKSLLLPLRMIFACVISVFNSCCNMLMQNIATVLRGAKLGTVNVMEVII